MRGVRVASPPRRSKADLMVVAARYGANGDLDTAKAYECHDQVWTDVKLYDRQALVDMIQAGKRVSFGAFVDLATDFKRLGRISLVESDGRQVLAPKGKATQHDDLGVPIF